MLRQTLDTPWAAANEVRRIAAQPAIRLGLALHGIRWGQGWRIFGMPIVQRRRGSCIELGDGLELRSWRTTNPLVPTHPVVLATRRAGALIRIGRDVAMTGATIVAAERVVIGDRVLVGANTTIVDTDFHPLDPAARRVDVLAGAHAPVLIEDDVFIGMSSIILKGVPIGASSVIGAGSVVTRDVPDAVFAAGNPCRVIRNIDEQARPASPSTDA